MSSFTANLFKSGCNASSLKEDRILEALVCFRNDIIEEIVKLRQLLFTVLHGSLLDASNVDNNQQTHVVSLLNEALQKNVGNFVSSVTSDSKKHCETTQKADTQLLKVAAIENDFEVVQHDDSDGQIEDDCKAVQQDNDQVENDLQPQPFASATRHDCNIKTEVSENTYDFEPSQSALCEEQAQPSSSGVLPSEHEQEVAFTEEDFILSSDTNFEMETYVYPVLDSSGKQLFGCVECGKTFAYKSGVEKHFRIHTGVKPYKCKLCGKSFSQKGSLKYHIDIHTGQKRHKCTTCGKSFVHKGNLNYHVKKHLRTSVHETDKVASPVGANM